jgi:signal transduction histidine kinase
MKLSTFIRHHLEEILTEWDAFAETLRPAAIAMSRSDLRDHAKQILTAIAIDIETEQTSGQEEEKSKGLRPSSKNSAAAVHGRLRQSSGFTLVQLAAEYRALRASVLRLWLSHITAVNQQNSADMIRFNESVDQAVAESIATYSKHAATVRDTFLAILGHDLRSPLSTMTMAGEYFTHGNVEADLTLQVGLRVKRSAATMTAMVNDLLEYARTQLDGKIPIAPHQVDIDEICQTAMDDARAAHPDCPFELETSGNLVGNFDRVRLHQVFTNLLNNAAQYREKGRPVRLLIEAERGAVTVHVRNFGPSIPPESLKTVFEPLVQLSVSKQYSGRPASSLGLGLFIAREITQAHGGTISAESDETHGTTFSVRLPLASVERGERT